MKIDMNKLPMKYWNYLTIVNYIQRFIIIHSIIYYELNDNVISDKDYDSISKLLLKLKEEDPDTYKKSQYYYVFKDFDGSTGFYIYDTLNNNDKKYLIKIANHVLYLNKKGVK